MNYSGVCADDKCRQIALRASQISDDRCAVSLCVSVIKGITVRLIGFYWVYWPRARRDYSIFTDTAQDPVFIMRSPLRVIGFSLKPENCSVAYTYI